MLFLSTDGARFEPYSGGAARFRRHAKIRRIDPLSGAHAVQASLDVDLTPEQRAATRNVDVYQRALAERNPTPQHAFLARDIMTPGPVTIAPGQGVAEVQRLFAAKGFRHLPVVNESGHLVGMVTDRDILKYSADSQAETRRLSVSDMMTPEAFAATPDTTIHDIAQLMLAERISSLPILGSEHDLLGIVTTTDILKGLIRRIPIELWV
jgi:CBS domain-containing protein